MHKPEIVDEAVYEIVGGTSKVLRPDLLDKEGRVSLEIAARTFVNNRNVATFYSLHHPHPEKPSETMLHQRMMRRSSCQSMQSPLRTTKRKQAPLSETAASSRVSRGGRYRGEDLAAKDASPKQGSATTDTTTSAAAAANKDLNRNGFQKPVRTCLLESVGLTYSDMTSLRGENTFQMSSQSQKSTKAFTPIRSKKIDSKHRFLRRIIQQTDAVQDTLNRSHPDLAIGEIATPTS